MIVKYDNKIRMFQQFKEFSLEYSANLDRWDIYISAGIECKIIATGTEALLEQIMLAIGEVLKEGKDYIDIDKMLGDY